MGLALSLASAFCVTEGLKDAGKKSSLLFLSNYDLFQN